MQGIKERWGLFECDKQMRIDLGIINENSTKLEGVKIAGEIMRRN